MLSSRRKLMKKPWRIWRRRKCSRGDNSPYFVLSLTLKGSLRGSMYDLSTQYPYQALEPHCKYINELGTLLSTLYYVKEKIKIKSYMTLMICIEREIKPQFAWGAIYPWSLPQVHMWTHNGYIENGYEPMGQVLFASCLTSGPFL